MKRRLRRWLPPLITLGLLAWLLSRLRLGEVLLLLRGAAWPWLLAGVTWYVVTNLWRAMRFATLLSLPRGWRLLPEMFALSFLNNTLPSRGGELSFPYFMHTRHGLSVGESSAALLVARLFDLVAVAALFVLFALGQRAQLTATASTVIRLTAVVLALGLAVLLLLPWAGRGSLMLLRRMAARFRLESRGWGQKLLAFAERAVEALMALRSPRRYLATLGWSLLIWLTLFAWLHAFVRALGFDYAFPQVVVGATFAVLAKSIPFLPTVGGFGPHEAGWALGFSLLGMEGDTAILSGFTVNLLTVATSALLGGTTLLLFSWRSRSDAESAAHAASPAPRREGRKVRGRRWLVWLLLLYLMVGGSYSVLNPLFEAPDEVWHYEYVRWLAEGHGLPTPEEVGNAPWHQEGSQPPLYYALAALLTAPIPTDDAPQVIRYNPHAAMGDPQAVDNRNVMLHGDAERWPWRGTVLAAHLARFVSLLLGALTVAATWGAARALRCEEATALLAAAFVAFNPQFLFLSASVNNDNLVTALSALILWRALVLMGAERLRRRDALLLGALAGAAALSKLSGLLTVVPVAAAIAWSAWRRRSWRTFVEEGILAAGAALLVGGWWYWRNWHLYGDPLGLPAMFAILPQRTRPPGLGELWLEWQGVWRSFWGVFGWFNLTLPGWLYGLYALLTLVPLAGLLLRLRRREEGRGPQVALLVGWTLLLLAALLHWAQMRYPQGRLLFPALSAVAVLMALGWRALLPARWRLPLSAALGLLLLLVAALVPWLWIRPAYAAPPTLPADSPLPHATDIPFGEAIHLVGWEVEPRSLAAGQPLTVTLYWRADAPPPGDYSVFLHLTDDLGLLQAQRDSMPAGGLLPTRDWPVGRIVVDRHRFVLPPTVPRALTLTLSVGLYDVASGARLPTPQGDAVALGEVWLEGDPAEPLPLELHFDDGIVLEGYRLEPRRLHPGDCLSLTLWWRAEAVPSRDYTVFVHLMIPPDSIWAQVDAMPHGGAFPTSQWQPGERIEDHYCLTLPDDAPPGLYEVEIGLYDLATLQRLTIGYRQDHVVLGAVRVEP